MGRYNWDKKDTVEDGRSVSVSFLRKHDYFCGYKSGTVRWTRNDEEVASVGITVSIMDNNNFVQFRYTTTDQSTGGQTEYDYKAYLTTTPCHFGGVRYWFLCPLSTKGIFCGRRVGTLYKGPGGKYFGCRHCYNLSYESRNESRLGRMGQIGYFLKCDRRREALYPQIKRWTYNGQLTRKAKQYHLLEAQMGNCQI